MKRKSTFATLVLGAAGIGHSQSITHQHLDPNKVTSVNTAINHISLIELPEPVLRVAIGSEDFKIEYHGNTVALKPAKQGQPTNLFVWTEHTKSTYEILAPSDLKNASFVIDETESKILAPVTTAEKRIGEDEVQKASDVMVAQTLLESINVNSRGIKSSKDHVNVRITSVIHDRDGLFVRYTVSNEGQHPYRVSNPVVTRFTPTTVEDASLSSLKGTQLTPGKVATLGGGNTDVPVIRESRIGNPDLTPGQSVDAVISFGIVDDKPHLYRFVFANDESKSVDAAAVL